MFEAVMPSQWANHFGWFVTPALLSHQKHHRSNWRSSHQSQHFQGTSNKHPHFHRHVLEKSLSSVNSNVRLELGLLQMIPEVETRFADQPHDKHRTSSPRLAP